MLMPEVIRNQVNGNEGGKWINQTDAAKLLGITAQTFREKYDTPDPTKRKPNRFIKQLYRIQNPRNTKEYWYRRTDVLELAKLPE